MSYQKSLRDLDSTIADSESYVEIKNKKIDSLRSIIKPHGKLPVSEEYAVLNEIISLYRQMDSDSAIRYALHANSELFQGMPDSLKFRAKLDLIDALATSGIFGEAFRLLRQIEPDGMCVPDRLRYYWTARRVFTYSLAYLQEKNVYADNYRMRYRETDDSLLKLLPASDPYFQFLRSERMVSEGKWGEAKRMLEELMEENPKESNIYGMSAYQLAEVYRNLGDYNSYLMALSLSAQSDIMGGIREGLSMPALANALFEMGDIENAFKYMNYALQEANNANIPIRTVSIADDMALIDTAYKKKLDSTNRATTLFLVIACCLLAVAIGLLAFLIRGIRRDRANAARLEESSLKLRDYVGNFISLCANYSTRLEQLGKLVTRKIKADQAEELVRLVGSGRFAEEDNEEFYKLIDKAFIDIFPDFIPRLNRLLKADSQLPDEASGSLTPELRIYACVRLGVDQSARIARILHYSVNTVYCYRNRMRNRAINRDSFDKDVENMGFQTS